MKSLLSAKGSDITSWRMAADFSGAYRQTLLDLAATDPSGTAEAVFTESAATLETAITIHRQLLQQLSSMIEEMATAHPSRRRELTIDFYDALYRHFDRFHSARAFFQLSMDFLRATSSAIVAQAHSQLGADAGQLPEMALIAIGPASRCEYSPFCPLQILLVHADTAASNSPAIDAFCQTLHTAFEEAGLSMDPDISPRNPDWRGTPAEWQYRCETEEDSINLCRLIDQVPLPADNQLASTLKEVSSSALRKNSFAVTNLVQRMTALSNGLSLMGKLKLERNGRFHLLNHGLLPLSAALSTLALIKNCAAACNHKRIHELLDQRTIDVELAERMLTTWHILHNLRLKQEQAFAFIEHDSNTLYLNPHKLTADQRQTLKETLEDVATIQRHVEIIFSEMGA